LTNQETSTLIRVLLAVGSPARERELRDALAEQGLAITGRFLDGPSLAERAQAFDAEVGLASSELHRLSQATLVAIREARLPLVLLAEPTDFETYAGLAHCLSRNAPAKEIAAAVRQAVARGVSYAAAPAMDGARPGATAGAGEDDEGRVIVLLGGKGAPGVTTLAIGLAAALSERNRRVVLVDADLRGGNVVPYLDLDPSRGILGLGVGRHGGSGALPVDEELQDGPGFMVLAGIERPETSGSVSAELAAVAVTRLRDVYDYVVVDAGEVVAGHPAAVAEALARTADRVLVVSGADLISAWNAQCCVRYLREELGLAPETLGVLLNRSAGRGGFGANEVEQALGVPVLAAVPEDRRAARRALAQQLPLTAVGGRPARRLRALAKQLTEQAQPVPQEGRRRRWPSRPRLMPLGRR
jgi:pilus assembly protein CpaE